MPIHGYTGLPRSGKSYGVFQNVIVPALKKGKVVWTNIPFNEEKVAAHCGSIPTFFKTQDILANDNWFQEVLPKGAVVVIDECWRLWPSGLKTNNVKEQHKSFLAEHGHMVGEDGYVTEVYLVTQDLAQIAAFARQLVDTTVRSTKLTSIGQTNRFKVEIYDGAVTGQKPPQDKKIRQMIGKYDPEIYSLYTSHTMSETGTAGDETVTDDRKNIFKGAGFKGVIAICCIVPIFAIWGFIKVRNSYSDNSHPSASGPVQQQTVVPVVKQPPKPKEKGFLDDSKLSIAMSLSDGKKTVYTIRVTKGNQYSVLDQHTLLRLGYYTFDIDPCLAMLVDHSGQKIYVQCAQDESTRKGLNLVDSVTESASTQTSTL